MRFGRRLRRVASRRSDHGDPTAANGAGGSNGAVANASRRVAGQASELLVDLERRRDQLVAKVAELQWDLGGLVYEMSVRNRIQIEVLVRRAVALQDADAELCEVERILRMEETGMAGSCASCGAPHSNGATFCWQCGQPLLRQLPSDAILRR
jgi:hypothetical protein